MEKTTSQNNIKEYKSFNKKFWGDKIKKIWVEGNFSTEENPSRRRNTCIKIRLL